MGLQTLDEIPVDLKHRLGLVGLLAILTFQNVAGGDGRVLNFSDNGREHFKIRNRGELSLPFIAKLEQILDHLVRVVDIQAFQAIQRS